LFRFLLFGVGAASLLLVAVYLASGNRRYLGWARWLLLVSIALGVSFSLVLLVQKVL
jgi:hypothetical protein